MVITLYRAKDILGDCVGGLEVGVGVEPEAVETEGADAALVMWIA